MSMFEWDEAKAKVNLEKHGIAFSDAALALLGLAMTVPSSRSLENRFASICMSGGRLITVIWTPRMGVIRIVSARTARKNEQVTYHQSVGAGSSGRRQ